MCFRNTVLLVTTFEQRKQKTMKCANVFISQHKIQHREGDWQASASDCGNHWICQSNKAHLPRPKRNTRDEELGSCEQIIKEQKEKTMWDQPIVVAKGSTTTQYAISYLMLHSGTYESSFKMSQNMLKECQEQDNWNEASYLQCSVLYLAARWLTNEMVEQL